MDRYASVDTKKVARSAILMAMSESRDQERKLAQDLAADVQTPIRACAVDFGGDFISSVSKIIERAVVASRREGIIHEKYRIDGAIAGATREACAQISNKAMGLNIGGKIGIARSEEDVAVCIFFGIGLLHLDEIAIGLGHRAI